MSPGWYLGCIADLVEPRSKLTEVPHTTPSDRTENLAAINRISNPSTEIPLHGRSVQQVLLGLLTRPDIYLLRRWNWKSALLSSLLRASLFFFTNLSAGWHAAVAALITELVFRGITSGFYGALTESFAEAEPPWAAALSAMVLLPLASHTLEFVVHLLRGTHNLTQSIAASVALTAISTLFNLYAMRRGALIVGQRRQSLGKDLRSLPRLMLDFILLAPAWLIGRVRRSSL